MNYTEEQKITKDQLKIINEKEIYNFEKCLLDNSYDKKKFDKMFRNDLDILIKTSLSRGILFFGFTINFFDVTENVTEEDKKAYWKMIHFRVEEFLTISKNHVELLEFIYLSIERYETKNLLDYNSEDKKITLNNFMQKLDKLDKFEGLPQIHGIIAIRSLLGKNNMLDTELIRLYIYFYNDIKIKPLNNLKKIKEYWNYVIKEQNYLFHRFSFFSKIYNDYGKISDDELILSFKENSLCTSLIENAIHNNISGISTNKENNKRILLYLINLHMHLNKIVICKNSFYEKIENSMFSWKLLSNISYLKENSIEILINLKKKFPQQLEHLDINQLILSSLELLCNDIIKNNKYLPSIELNDSAIEFSDGLYFLNYNYFLNFKYNKNNEIIKKLNINCYKYFKKTFTNCLKNKPKKWLNILLQNMDNKINELEEFCANLGRYFHLTSLINLNLNSKKKIICVGNLKNRESNILLVNIIVNSIQSKKINIDIISKEIDTFVFEEVEHKKIVMCDELKYSSISTNMHDLFENVEDNLILLNKNIEDTDLYLNLNKSKIPILFIFDENITDKMLEDKIFINKLLIYTFTYQYKTTYLNVNEELKKALIDEFPQIMIYCNKLYFKKNNIKNSKKRFLQTYNII